MTEVPEFKQVNLNDLGLGQAYVLAPHEGEHSRANNSSRTLLARAVDTSGDMSIIVSEGDESSPTMPHYHERTSEALYVISGVIRVWLDDQQGNRYIRDVHAGEFGTLPRGWIHAWAFAAPKSKQFGIIAPGGFERIVDYLDPEKPSTIEQLRASEETIDVKWLPDYPLFELCEEAERQRAVMSV